MKKTILNHIKHNGIAYVALFFALTTGGAYAAQAINGKLLVNNSVTGAKIKNGSVTHADLAKNSVRGPQVLNNSLTGADIKNGTISRVDLANDVFTTGFRGPKGDPGAAGAKGDKGDPGVAGANGTNGADGANGANGADGAYAIAGGIREGAPLPVPAGDGVVVASDTLTLPAGVDLAVVAVNADVMLRHLIIEPPGDVTCYVEVENEGGGFSNTSRVAENIGGALGGESRQLSLNGVLYLNLDGDATRVVQLRCVATDNDRVEVIAGGLTVVLSRLSL